MVATGAAGLQQGWSPRTSYDGSVAAWGVPINNAGGTIGGGVFVYKKNSSGLYYQYTTGYLSGTGYSGGSPSQGRSIGMSSNGSVIAWGGSLSNVGSQNIGGVS